MYFETLCSLPFIHVTDSIPQRLFLNSLQSGLSVSIFKAKGLRSAAPHTAFIVEGDPSSLGSGEPTGGRLFAPS